MINRAVFDQRNQQVLYVYLF